MDVQELVRLVRDGVSDREIAALVGLNRRTVTRYRHWATQQHLLAGPLLTVGELHQRLQATLPVHLPPQQTSSVAAYHDQIRAYRQQGLELAAIRARLEEQQGVAEAVGLRPLTQHAGRDHLLQCHECRRLKLSTGGCAGVHRFQQLEAKAVGIIVAHRRLSAVCSTWRLERS